MNLRASGVLARLVAFVAASVLPLAAYSAPTVTGSFAPSQVGSNTPSTLTLNYAGFTSDSVGMVLRIYYDSAKVTPGSVVYSNPPGSSQPANSPTAGTLAGCADANTYIALNWVDFGATWPTPTAGQLATVQFTSANPFTSNALVCWVDDTSQGAPQRNITGNATLNAPPPTATIAVAPASVPDNGSALTYTVTISPPPAATTPVTVTSSVVGTMTGVTNGCTGTVSVSTGGTGTCTISATNTVPFDGPAAATVNLGAGAGYVVGVPSSASGTITNDDLPTVSIAASPAAIFDSPGNVSTVTVTLSAAAPAGGFPVNLTPPAANPRYTTTCGSSLTIAAGSTTATCTVTATPNTVVGDGNVTAPVAIAANAAYTITGTNPAVVTIQDDDIPVISTVCVPTTLTDSAGQTSTCTISSDKALAAPLTVNLNPPAANARYTTTCGSTISVPAGAAGTSNTCTISAVANTTVGDGNVTATLSVANGDGYTVGGSTQNVAINNDDFASISVAVSPASVTENSGTPMVYTFTASVASTSATSILFTPPAVSGRYSTTCVSPISLPAGDTTVTCSVTPINNNAVDGTATATVTLLPSAGVYTVGAPSVATGTITDDEIGVGVVAASPTITEGGNAIFTISCQGVATVAVSYSFSGTYIPLPANGGNSVTCGTPLVVTVPTIDDSVPNGDRTLILTITNVEQPGAVDPAKASATVVVLDNDAPRTIPTMSTLGLMLLGLLLTAAAGFGIRRKA